MIYEYGGNLRLTPDSTNNILIQLDNILLTDTTNIIVSLMDTTGSISLSPVINFIENGIFEFIFNSNDFINTLNNQIILSITEPSCTTMFIRFDKEIISLLDNIKSQTDQMIFDTTSGFIISTLDSYNQGRIIDIYVYEDSTTIPIMDVYLTIKNQNGQVIKTGKTNIDGKFTNLNGVIGLSLEDGTYKVVPTKTSVNFDDYTEIIVDSSSSNFIVYGTPLSISIPVYPSLQTVWGTILKADGTPDTTQVITADVRSPMFIDSNLLSRTKLKTTSDSLGNFYLVILQGSEVYLNITNYTGKLVTITNENLKNIKEYFE